MKDEHIEHELRLYILKYIYINLYIQRSAVVEWLEQLGYGVESRRIARVRGSAAPCGDWQTLSVNPAENGYLFRIRQRKERDGLRFSSAVPKIQWDSNPHCPYGC